MYTNYNQQLWQVENPQVNHKYEQIAIKTHFLFIQIC